jgi:hypothetical protein
VCSCQLVWCRGEDHDDVMLTVAAAGGRGSLAASAVGDLVGMCISGA